jgi:low temperature requirement protein LtrA
MSTPVVSEHSTSPNRAPLRRSMTARSPHEVHRSATPLELFFDLVFVVAIAQAANGLHHAIAEGHAVEGLVGYLMVFFAIWWAWMNFTWFASAYDCDDIAYRLAVFVQISGALVLAAGVAGMFQTHGPDPAVVAGYVLMRLAAVTQWLRAAAADPVHRTTARRYAIGIAALQVACVATVFLPQLFGPAFLILVAFELAVPVWAEAAGQTTWHPHHISERYGLLTLIVLGELILAATLAVQSALASGERLSVLTPIIVGGLLIAFSMWWLYFDRPVHDLLTSFRKAMVWGYGHYLVFASAAGVGAGLAAAVDEVTHHGNAAVTSAGMAVALSAAVYLLSLWFLHDRPEYRRTRMVGPIAAVLVLLAPLSGSAAVPVIGLILAAVVAAKLMIRMPGL